MSRPVLRAASLFSGGPGGSSLGIRRAGFRVIVANEFNRGARAAYELNAPWYTLVDDRSIAKLAACDLLAPVTGDGGHELDLLDGSPPCQSWSTAGCRGRADDERGRLLWEWARLAEEVVPYARALVMENVSGLADEKALPYLRDVMERLDRAGYAVEARALLASRFGVPQDRERVFVVGFRRDLGIDPSLGFPKEDTGTATIGEVLPHVARVVRVARPPRWPEEKTWPSVMPVSTVTASGIGYWSWQHVLVEERDGSRRRIEIDELAALCGFPTGMEFPERMGYGSRWKCIGNAVPPMLMQRVAKSIAKALTAADGRE